MRDGSPMNNMFRLVGVFACLLLLYNVYRASLVGSSITWTAYFNKRIHEPPKKEEGEEKPWKEEKFHQRSHCFYKAFFDTPDGDVWAKLSEATASCQSKIPLKEESIEGLQNDDEVKRFLMPLDGVGLNYCNIISLGIGHDVKVETKLKKLFPTCGFHGADPITKVNEEIYKPIGTYHPFAVGNQSKTEWTMVKEDPSTQAYTNKEFVHVELVEFLRDHAKIPPMDLIDQLLLDIEYAEYAMFDYFYKGGKLDQAGYTICQWNGEFHKPNEVQKTAFGQFLKRISHEERYLYFNAVQGWHTRLFFVNVEDSRCYDRYVAGRL
ncbi:hypothetical protein L596_023341 [Steinernema carpocapsae]|uniref:Methyltransferase FkbM domain-containing protein n=1 Tax=Steinernema carpocapsae TaxID=34508 RepID=A0A4U5ME46_STECR|nr:hypothetical protein L596_023341 [Steinernema carpocapsae]